MPKQLQLLIHARCAQCALAACLLRLQPLEATALVVLLGLVVYFWMVLGTTRLRDVVTVAVAVAAAVLPLLWSALNWSQYDWFALTLSTVIGGALDVLPLMPATWPLAPVLHGARSIVLTGHHHFDIPLIVGMCTILQGGPLQLWSTAWPIACVIKARFVESQLHETLRLARQGRSRALLSLAFMMYAYLVEDQAHFFGPAMYLILFCTDPALWEDSSPGEARWESRNGDETREGSGHIHKFKRTRDGTGICGDAVLANFRARLTASSYQFRVYFIGQSNQIGGQHSEAVIALRPRGGGQQLNIRYAFWDSTHLDLYMHDGHDVTEQWPRAKSRSEHARNMFLFETAYLPVREVMEEFQKIQCRIERLHADGANDWWAKSFENVKSFNCVFLAAQPLSVLAAKAMLPHVQMGGAAGKLWGPALLVVRLCTILLPGHPCYPRYPVAIGILMFWCLPLLGGLALGRLGSHALTLVSGPGNSAAWLGLFDHMGFLFAAIHLVLTVLQNKLLALALIPFGLFASGL